MLFLLEEDSALGLQSKLQNQGQILNPEAIEILHLSSYSDDSAFRDEKSPLWNYVGNLFTDDWSHCVYYGQVQFWPHAW